MDAVTGTPSLAIESLPRARRSAMATLFMSKRGRDSSSSDSESDSEDRTLGPSPVPIIASVDSPIDDSNIGFVLLRKMGYSSGGLGLTRIGRADPVPFVFKDEKLGLGKDEVESQVLLNTTLTQKRMASVLMLDETNAERERRETKVAEKERIQAELAETLKTYLCVDCEKQYRNIRQYNDHLQSYDHHHRKRFKAMQAEQRATAAASGETEKRRDKERRREAQELARLGMESGFAAAPSIPTEAEGSASTVASASVASTGGPVASTSTGSGFKKLGAQRSQVSPASNPPAFRSSGFVTLETGSAPLPIRTAPKPADGLKVSFGGSISKPTPMASTKKASAFGDQEDDEDEGLAKAGSAYRQKGLGKAPGSNGIKISLAPKR